jgi:hypothetical protein
MSQTWVTIDQTTHTATQCIGHLDDKHTTLRSAWSGSSAPSSPVQGQLWLDTSASEYVLKVYADLEGTGAAWYEIGKVLHGDLKLRNNQLVDVRIENLNSHTTPASGVVGEIYLYTTDSKARLIVSATVREVLMSASNVDFVAINVPASAFERDISNPPTAATKGTTPTLRGWLFDNANELASIAVRVPAGYAADANCKLRLLCVLNQAETSGDDIDWTVDRVCIKPAAAEVVSGTSTQETVAQDMSTFVSDGAVHAVDIALVYNDATNPIEAGDLLVMEFHRTNLANCGGVIVVGAQVLFPFGTKITE